MSLYGIEKFKLEQYQKLICKIPNCKDLDEAIALIAENDREIALYTKGFQDAQPKSFGPYGDR